MLKRFCLLLLGCFACTCVYAQDTESIRLAEEYLNKNETGKARAIFEKLAKKQENIPLIHNAYLDLLLSEQDYKEAIGYLNRQIRQGNDQDRYKLELAIVYQQSNEQKQADALFNELLSEAAQQPYKTHRIAQLFSSKRLFEKALEAYQRARQLQKNTEEGQYALQMANLYRVLGQKEEMLEEYLNYVDQHPRHLDYARNMLQNILNEPEDLAAFESYMLDKVQADPDNLNYLDLLIWAQIQQKNFYGAFIQTRAKVKRYRMGPEELIEIGRLTLDNEDYQNAINIFEYTADNFKDDPRYFMIRRLLIKAREELVKNSYPVKRGELEKLVADYSQLVEEAGINSATLEALHSQALLYAFYLDEKDSAIHILQQLININRAHPELIARSKLALGDIYLLKGEPWESTLLYSQVEKAHKESPIGYEAKLRNARLSYYKGEFSLAEGHLDILKEATTREIANDAMALSLLLKDNTVFDSTDTALKRYAEAELLLFQHKKEAAYQQLEALLTDIPGHSLTDEILYLQAGLLMETGHFDQAKGKLDKIIEGWSYDILGDDAWFLRAKLLEEYLNQPEEALKQYQELLQRFPGSRYVAEARKRFRTLRGDFKQPAQ